MIKKILRRLDDNMGVYGHIQFIKFDEETYKAKNLSDSIVIGGCAIVDLKDGKFVWQTSQITSKISNTEFTTKNSHYIIEDTKEVYDSLSDFIQSVT